MPAKEIKELREAGKLVEAYEMAILELDADPENIWAKRNISWVLYKQMDTHVQDFELFLTKLKELKGLNLPASEEMLFDNLSIVLSKAARYLSQANENHQAGNLNAGILLDQVKDLPLKRPSKWYSVLFSAFNKMLKDSERYIEFAEWWDFKNLRDEDYVKEKLPNGKEVMAIAEQGYINFAKHLLPKQDQRGQISFNREKAEMFVNELANISERHPEYMYPAYFQAKLLLALGDKDNLLSALLPFAKKKRNDFWAWEIFAEAFPNDEPKQFTCYCRALLCKSPEEMLVGLRQKMTRLLINRQFYAEAKTEIGLIIKTKKEQGHRIPNEVETWITKEWFKVDSPVGSNESLYKRFSGTADNLLYSDVPEEYIIVEFVNTDKRILNFIASEEKTGFFKYDQFLKKVSVGDILKVRFQSGTPNRLYKVYTAELSQNEDFRKKYFQIVDGILRVPEGKGFGFIGDVYVHPSIIKKENLSDGESVKGAALKTFNSEKGKWTWKLLLLNSLKIKAHGN
jgi:hypothetical protein